MRKAPARSSSGSPTPADSFLIVAPIAAGSVGGRARPHRRPAHSPNECRLFCKKQRASTGGNLSTSGNRRLRIPVATGRKRCRQTPSHHRHRLRLGEKIHRAGLDQGFREARGGRRFPRHWPNRNPYRRPGHPDRCGRGRFRRRRGRNAQSRRACGSLGRDRRPGLALASGIRRSFARFAARQPARCDCGLPPTWSRVRRRSTRIIRFRVSRKRSIWRFRLGRRTNPAIRCAGVSLNTAQLEPAAATSFFDAGE